MAEWAIFNQQGDGDYAFLGTAEANANEPEVALEAWRSANGALHPNLSGLVVVTRWDNRSEYVAAPSLTPVE